MGFLKESAQEYLHNLKISFCFPHIGTQGLSSFQMGRENWKQSKESREARLLQEMANFIREDDGMQHTSLLCSSRLREFH